MATGALDSNGIWQYGEDDSNTTFSALLNRLGSSTSTQVGLVKTSGRVLNTVTTTKLTEWSTTSTTYADVTGMSATITPKSSSNKVLVTMSFIQGISGASNSCTFKMRRNSTDIGVTAQGHSTISYIATASGGGFVTLQYLDSPATTSATTYKLQGRVDGAGLTGYVGRYPASSGLSISSIVLKEIAA